MSQIALLYFSPDKLKSKLRTCAIYVLASSLPGPVTLQAMEISRVVVDTTFNNPIIILPLLFGWIKDILIEYVQKAGDMAKILQMGTRLTLNGKEDGCF
jgi:hypothetical protein